MPALEGVDGSVRLHDAPNEPQPLGIGEVPVAEAPSAGRTVWVGFVAAASAAMAAGRTCLARPPLSFSRLLLWLDRVRCGAPDFKQPGVEPVVNDRLDVAKPLPLVSHELAEASLRLGVIRVLADGAVGSEESAGESLRLREVAGYGKTTATGHLPPLVLWPIPEPIQRPIQERMRQYF